MFITFGDKFNTLAFYPNFRCGYIIYFIKIFQSFSLHIQLSGQGNSANEAFYSVLPCVSPGTGLSCAQGFCLFVFSGFANKCIHKSCFEEHFYSSARFFSYKHSCKSQFVRGTIATRLIRSYYLWLWTTR